MAICLLLSAECGECRSKAEAFASHFTFSVTDAQNRALVFKPQIIFDETWWCIVHCESDGRVLVDGSGGEEDFDKIADLLYQRLRTAPPFRYALAGFDTDGFRKISELDDDLIECNFSGLTLSLEIWEFLGSPKIFVPFEAGYVWRPFVSVWR